MDRTLSSTQNSTPQSTGRRPFGAFRSAGGSTVSMSGAALAALALFAAGPMLLTGCGSGSSELVVDPPSDDDSDEFAVSSTSVINGSTWKLNREILIEFTQDVDFSTVTLSTVQIIDTFGVPAVGTFSAADARTIRFQPTCPTNDTNSDGGFAQGRTYRLSVLSQSSSNGGGVTVRSTAGDVLTTGLNVTFVTEESVDELVLYVDNVAGPPQVRILAGPNVPDPSGDPLDSGFSYVEFGDGDIDFFSFQPATQLGEGERAVPLNLYSDVDQQFSVILNFNQAILGASTNVNSELIRLQYEESPDNWERVPSTVAVVENCTATGAAVRLTPTGIVPQGVNLRILLREGFRDITGDRIQSTQTSFAHFESDVANPGSVDSELGSDEILERFTLPGGAIGSLEDTTVTSPLPRAEWGTENSPGAITASLNFDGTGGLGSEFDVVVVAGQELVVDTDSDTITSSLGLMQPVINGVIDIRNLTVETGGLLRFIGPNTATILATGEVTVNGRISVDGQDSDGVGSMNTTDIPEPGASGNAGGGAGGVGSQFTSQSTPRGGTGNGAFEVSARGGQGGESSFATAGTCGIENRRAAGGGGGSFGPSIRYFTEDGPDLPLAICQILIGMDAEPGFPGSLDGTGADELTGAAGGGSVAPGPFGDEDPNNNFFGTMITAGGLQITGELNGVWAGSGGGGGGDAVSSETFPSTPFSASGDEKGAGGGGGAGGLLILALGDIVVGDLGSITADGGSGGGGENFLGFDRVGGGSGGGSGGHIVLASDSSIRIFSDINQAFAGSFYQDNITPGGGGNHFKRPVRALGGQGGSGRGDECGSGVGGDTTWRSDAIPIAAFENRLDIPPLGPTIQDGFLICNEVANCTVADPPPLGTRLGAGGDGGPGLIQLHVGDPDTQLSFNGSVNEPLDPPQTGYVTSGIDVTRALSPPPVGWTAPNVTPDVLIPFFSSRSESFSRWIPLGLARTNGVDPLNAVEFFFEGTDPNTGVVLRDGDMAEELSALLDFTDLSQGGALPSIDAASATVRVAAGDVMDPNGLYGRNPLLLREFVVRLRDNAGDPAVVREFTVVNPSRDQATGDFLLEVDPRFTALDDALALLGGDGSDLEVELIPYFVRLFSDDISDLYPVDTEVSIVFDATLEDSFTGLVSDDPAVAFSGRADVVANDLAVRNGFAEDINDLNGSVVVVNPTDPNTGAMTPLSDQTEAVSWDFFRFKVQFDLLPMGGTLDPQKIRPGVDYLRIPFRF